ncbi:MAG: hypothetical protein ACLGHC_08680 [Alphaproteobacteria bacterium]
MTSCVSLPISRAAEESTESPEGLSWESIVRGIRVHARRQLPEVAEDLERWADFLEGVAQLERERNRG